MTHPDFLRRLLSRVLIVASLTLMPAYAPAAHAASGVRIGEVAWAGSSASLADEWIEMWNLSDAEMPLQGYSLVGASSNPIFFPDEAVIPARGTYLVANYAEGDAKSALASAPQMVTTTVSLSNSALLVTLLDASGTEIDRAGDGGTPTAGLSGAIKATMVREGEGWTNATSSFGFDDGKTDLGTPGRCDGCLEEQAEGPPMETTPVPEEETATSTEVIASTSTEAVLVVEIEPVTSSTDPLPSETFSVASSTEILPTVATSTVITEVATTTLMTTTTATIPVTAPVTTSASSASLSPPPAAPIPHYELLRLHELIPQPDTGPEWIEITSLNPNIPVPLKDVRLHDATGKIYTFATGTLDGTNPYAQAFLTSSRLNNGGDTVTLRDPSGGILDSFTYGSSKKGEAVGPHVIVEEEPVLSEPEPELLDEEEPSTPVVEAAVPIFIEPGVEQPTATTVPKPKTTPKPKATAPKPVVKKTPAPKPAKTPAKSTKAVPAAPQPITIDMTNQDSNAGIRVSLQGTVASPPGLLTGHGFILLSADGRGLLVRVPTSRKLPDMGAVVTVNGTLIFSDLGVPSLKLNKNDDWTAHPGVTETSSPRVVDLVTPGTEDAWSLVQVTGTVRGIKGSTVTLDLADVEIDVAIKAVTKYRAARLAVGDTVTVRGLLDLTLQEPRLLPRSTDDIVIVKHAEVKAKEKQAAALPGWTPFGAAGVAIAGTESFKHLRQRRKQHALEKMLQTGVNSPNE